MARFLPLCLLIACSALYAQTSSAAPQQERYSVSTLIKYCGGVEQFSASVEPRIFAQVLPALDSSWVEFASKAAWNRAGRPEPAALVWLRENRVVRVVLTTEHQGAHGYADYCYRPDGSLASLQPVPAVHRDCDPSLVHCNVKIRTGRLYPPKSLLPPAPHAPDRSVPNEPSVGQWVDWDSQALFQPESSSIHLVPSDAPEYLGVADLPFSRLLYPSAN